MKKNKVDGFDKRKTFTRWKRDQGFKTAKSGETRIQFAMRAIWLTLGAACAALGWVLLTILLR
jgi:hypothetical protein